MLTPRLFLDRALLLQCWPIHCAVTRARSITYLRSLGAWAVRPLALRCLLKCEDGPRPLRAPRWRPWGHMNYLQIPSTWIILNIQHFLILSLEDWLLVGTAFLPPSRITVSVIYKCSQMFKSPSATITRYDYAVHYGLYNGERAHRPSSKKYFAAG